MARIFISYRREDSEALAGRLYDRLSQQFGRKNIFIDIDTIEPGLDFVEVIERTVTSCEVCIALIGRQWLTLTDPSGQRRLDNSEDFVRLEIATALKRNIRVIPALIQGTPMPRSPDLPEELRPLTRRNALEISNLHFHRDVDQLIEVLERVLRTATSDTQQNGPSDSAPAAQHDKRGDSATSPASQRRTAILGQPHAPRRGMALIYWGIGCLSMGGIVAVPTLFMEASPVRGVAILLSIIVGTTSVLLLVKGFIARRRG